MEMIKKVNVSFDFDPKTEVASNIVCTINGVEKKKATRSKKVEVVEEMATEPIITLEATKLQFNNKAVADMELEWEDRIVIKWESEKGNKKKLFPIIGKDLAFDEEGAGNKITKTNSIGYKGKQNAVLAEYGNIFTIEPFGDEIWRLVPTTTSVTVAAPKTEKVVVTTKVEPILVAEPGDEQEEISEIGFTL